MPKVAKLVRFDKEVWDSAGERAELEQLPRNRLIENLLKKEFGLLGKKKVKKSKRRTER